MLGQEINEYITSTLNDSILVPVCGSASPLQASETIRCPTSLCLPDPAEGCFWIKVPPCLFSTMFPGMQRWLFYFHISETATKTLSDAMVNKSTSTKHQTSHQSILTLTISGTSSSDSKLRLATAILQLELLRHHDIFLVAAWANRGYLLGIGSKWRCILVVQRCLLDELVSKLCTK